MKQPNLTEIKLRSGIPADAKFIGWVIWNPVKDDFLRQFREDAYSLFKEWCIYPDLAMRFKKYKKAVQTRNDLELKGHPVVAAFDCGPEIRIGN
ncbi:hypothetical protein [Vibrio nigripulchritudo]|uniref:hypothetical protein n=1 Tax=Vibrio nigripulchritudo TaxID=28173 RepID=UPI0003B1C26B|nr:hypothetical protein [Vibrio nigripulchritudo]CCN70143.1 hypothetical protein VIBNISFn118_1800004 [Vibrio nigripulchritudo SFn118]